MLLAGDKNVREHFYPLTGLNFVGTTVKVLNAHMHT